jgi:hypothetical protein
MTKKVADLSAYQGSSETYMKFLKVTELIPRWLN